MANHVSDELSPQMYCTVKLSPIIIEEMKSFQDCVEHAISIISNLNSKTFYCMMHACCTNTVYTLLSQVLRLDVAQCMHTVCKLYACCQNTYRHNSKVAIVSDICPCGLKFHTVKHPTLHRHSFVHFLQCCTMIVIIL